MLKLVGYSIKGHNVDAIKTDNELWDAQIKEDFLSGKLDRLIEEARKEFSLRKRTKGNKRCQTS